MPSERTEFEVKSPQRSAVFAALLLAPVLGACGFSAQTDQVYQAATGVNNRDGHIYVLDALIVSGADGSGTLSTTLDNESDTTADKLTDVSGDGVTGTLKPVVIPAQGSVNLSTSGDVSLAGDNIKAGNFVTITLSFASGQTTTVTVPVERHDGDYADVPLPKPKATATATPQ